MAGFFRSDLLNEEGEIMIDSEEVTAVQPLYSEDRATLTGCRIYAGGSVFAVKDPPYTVLDAIGDQRVSDDTFSVVTRKPLSPEIEAILRDASLSIDGRKEALIACDKALNPEDLGEPSKEELSEATQAAVNHALTKMAKQLVESIPEDFKTPGLGAFTHKVAHAINNLRS